MNREDREDLEHVLGIVAYLILVELEVIKENQMALADQIARLQADITELQGDVTAISGAVITPDQTAALDQVATDLENLHNTLVGLAPH